MKSGKGMAKTAISFCMSGALLSGMMTTVFAEESNFDETKGIAVMSREDGSGTRGAFIELLGIEQKNADGEKEDMTTEDASITNSTSVMMQSVAGNEYAIGYISLGSLDDSVKALFVDGVEPSVETVKSGDYAVARPFNIATVETVSDAAQDFINYILSSEGQSVIEENGYVPAVEGDAFETSGVEGKVSVAGSSSVSPVMEKLIEGYAAYNDVVTVELQTSDSTTGMTSAMDGSCDIGMASRALKDSETEGGLVGTTIAMDGIAIIVNNDNPMENISSEAVCQIYTGEVTSWDTIPEAGSDKAALVDPDFDYSKGVAVLSREDGSGTRGAFIELLGIEQKNADGEKEDMTTEDASITNSTSVMMQSVAGNEYAIGYISLGSLDDSVKAVTVDGVEASAKNVKSGDYTVARPFNIATKETVSEAAQDFIHYILSSEGQAVIEENGYVATAEGETFETNGAEGKVSIAGSSSVSPVMEKLIEGYASYNDAVTIELQTSDSTTGMTSAMDGSCDIGMASRALKDSEMEGGLIGTTIAMDGIAVIVNNASPIMDLSSETIQKIYTGEITVWEELVEE